MPSPTNAPVSPPAQVDELASYRDKITVTFERRPDGGLRVYSDELPGLALSHADHAAVLADLKPAIEVLLSHKLADAEAERDEALREHTSMMWQRRRADERADAAEAERDAALARAERLEKALREDAQWHESEADRLDCLPQNDFVRWQSSVHAEQAAKARAALAQPAPAEET